MVKIECGVSLTVKRSFQEKDNGSIPIAPLHNIQLIDYKESKRFVEKWHYSKRMPTGKNICYGLYINSNLYAVIVYGIGVNPYQSKYLNCKQVIEIKRMCRTEPIRNYPLSRLISITTKWVRKEMWFDMIVAFADPQYGHEGTVYKASGFKYHGTTNPEYHLVSKDGEIRHRRYAYRYSRRNNMTIKQARDELGLKPIKTLPKHRWIKKLK